MFGPIASLSLLQITLWGCIAALLVGTLFALRSRWANRRPMRRCILLSTAAHLLLIAVAASVRFATLPPGDGVSKPVRVSLVAPLPRADRVQAAAPIEPMEYVREPDQEGTPSESPPSPNESEANESEPNESEPSENEPREEPVRDLPKPPPLMEAPTPATAEPQPILAQTPPSRGAEAPGEESFEDQQVLETPSHPETAETPTADEPITPVVAADSQPPSPSVAETSNTSATPSIDPPPAAPINPPQPMADRVRPDRLVSVIEQGGSRETEQAVAEALEWLAYAQSPDGRWDASRWEGGREMKVLNQDRGGAGRNADTGISALALLAFLGAGHSHLDGGYRPQVTAGLNFLIQSQAPDGNLAGNAIDKERTYCHSMATFALAEAYALTGDQRLEPAVRRGAEYLIRTQHRQSGAWRYHPGQPGDVSQLGWVVMALRSAELGGIAVPESTWLGIERFLAQVSRGQHGGLACYMPQSPVSASMTAEALYCRQVLGKPPSGRGLDEGVQLIAADLPGRGQANYYYWYYATLALHKAQRDTSASGAAWRDWNEHLKETLVASQVKEGSNHGSWSPNSLWGGYGGRVYTTAMAAMCLEVYYRFGSPQEGEIPWVAGRPRTEATSR